MSLHGEGSRGRRTKLVTVHAEDSFEGCGKEEDTTDTVTQGGRSPSSCLQSNTSVFVRSGQLPYDIPAKVPLIVRENTLS